MSKRDTADAPAKCGTVRNDGERCRRPAGHDEVQGHDFGPFVSGRVPASATPGSFDALVEYELAQFGLASAGADRRIVESVCRLMQSAYDGGRASASAFPSDARHALGSWAERLDAAITKADWAVVVNVWHAVEGAARVAREQRPSNASVVPLRDPCAQCGAPDPDAIYELTRQRDEARTELAALRTGSATSSAGLTFDALRAANVKRLPLFKDAKGRVVHNDDGSDWSPAQWLQAVTGELGEYANLRKKVERGDVLPEEAKPMLAKELADVVIYLDILAFQLRIDLGVAVTQKWNEVSERIGVDIRIDAPCPGSASAGETWAKGFRAGEDQAAETLGEAGHYEAAKMLRASFAKERALDASPAPRSSNASPPDLDFVRETLIDVRAGIGREGDAMPPAGHIDEWALDDGRAPGSPSPCARPDYYVVGIDPAVPGSDRAVCSKCGQDVAAHLAQESFACPSPRASEAGEPRGDGT